MFSFTASNVSRPEESTGLGKRKIGKIIDRTVNRRTCGQSIRKTERKTSDTQAQRQRQRHKWIDEIVYLAILSNIIHLDVSTFQPDCRFSEHGVRRKLYQANNCLFVLRNLLHFLSGGQKPSFNKPWLSHQRVSAYAAGQALKLKCHASGNPTPTIRWKKNGRRLSKLQRSYLAGNRRILSFEYLLTSDAGTYTCIARNHHGSINRTFIVRVVGKFLKIIQRTFCFSRTIVFTRHRQIAIIQLTFCLARAAVFLCLFPSRDTLKPLSYLTRLS